ncbi:MULTISPECIES: hypothetical protein [Erwinia]|uniref:Uncharacterized protein n=1 Tax=Erwinia plantamica TaxID=3237104 RepID=A0ABW7CIZ2_9GAMM
MLTLILGGGLLSFRICLLPLKWKRETSAGLALSTQHGQPAVPVTRREYEGEIAGMGYKGISVDNCHQTLPDNIFYKEF